MSNIFKKVDWNHLLKTKTTALILLAVYLVVGLMLVSDYSIGTDEPIDRDTTLKNYMYVMSEALKGSDLPEPPGLGSPEESLMEWKDRFYGTALYLPTAAVEHIFGFNLSTRKVFVMRHIYNLMNYILAAFCFYLILRRRFRESHIPLMGMLLFILYPRFFGEAFFNNKDILFYAWCVISSYFVLRWLEKDDFLAMILAAGALALASNTRILGLSILLLAVFFKMVIGIFKKKAWRPAAKSSGLLILCFFALFVLVTPYTWENPLKNTINIFFHFIHFDPWDSLHYYMGEMITKEVPWHYIPVWMGITTPTFYTLFFFVGLGFLGIAGFCAIRRRKKAEETDCLAKMDSIYDIFFLMMFFCTLFGYIGLRITMYEGWRHAYALFLPFLYIIVYGLWAAFRFLRSRKKIFQYALATVTASSMLLTCGWLVREHPYQNLYFNPLVRTYAIENYAWDCWCLTHYELMEYILENDDRDYITVKFYERRNMMLPTSKQGILHARNDHLSPDYFVQSSRGGIDENRWKPGYVEVASVKVDGFKAAILYKYLVNESNFDPNAGSLVEEVTSSGTIDDVNRFFDGELAMHWITNGKQKKGDYIQFKFSQAVSYNFLRLEIGEQHLKKYPRDLKLLVSSDGVNWEHKEFVWNSSTDYLLPEGEYKYIRLECDGADEGEFKWTIGEVYFGNVDEKLFTEPIN